MSHEPQTMERPNLAVLCNALDGMTDGFASFDHQFRFTYINAAAARLLDKTSQELAGYCVWDVFPEAHDTPFRKAMEQALDETGSSKSKITTSQTGVGTVAAAIPRRMGYRSF